MSGLYDRFPFTASPGTPGGGGAASFGGGGGDDHTVLTSDLDTVPGFLAAKMVQGQGIVLQDIATGPGGRKILVSAASTPQASFGQELYSYSLGESESAITRTGIPGTDSSGWRAFAFIAQRDFLAASMAVAIRNTGGNWMRLGLFDAAGNRLQVSPRFAPVSNSIVGAILDAPVQLVGSDGYYMGYWSDDTTGNLQFSVLTGRSTSNRSPLMQRCDGNENAGNLSAAFAFTPLRPWLMVME